MAATLTGAGVRPEDVLARMLARRDLSILEARERLKAAGVAPAAVEEAVRWAVSSGYLDDARLAARLVERELVRKPPPAAKLLARRLEARGIAHELVAPAVRAGAAPETVAARLAAYVRALSGKLPARRLAGRLARAGHAPEAVAALLGSASQNEDLDDEDVDEHEGRFDEI